MKAYFLVPGPKGGAFELRETPRPEVRAARVIVRVRAAGLNRGELLALPAYRSDDLTLKPAPAGIEFAGEIAEAGPDATGWRVGEKVMGRAPGAYGEFISVGAAQLMRMPERLSFSEGAAIPNVFITAHDAISTAARVQPGESVLVTAASSGIGTAAIQIAKFLGAAKVIATSRSTAKTDALKALGANTVLNTSRPDWVDELRAATDSRGPDVIIDSVGGPMLADNLRAIAIGGRLISVGRNAGDHGDCDMDLLAFKRASLIGVTFRTRSPQEAFLCAERFMDTCLSAFGTGALRPVLDRTFPFADLHRAHDYMMANAQVGKVVLNID